MMEYYLKIVKGNIYLIKNMLCDNVVLWKELFLGLVHGNPGAELGQFNQRIESLMNLPIAQAERQIAEDRFRKPKVIFNRWAIRPFWRDRRKAPPLYKKVYKGDEAAYLISRGHLSRGHR